MSRFIIANCEGFITYILAARHAFKIQNRLEEGCYRIVVTISRKDPQIWIQFHRCREIPSGVQIIDAAPLCSRRVALLRSCWVDVTEVPVWKHPVVLGHEGRCGGKLE